MNNEYISNYNPTKANHHPHTHSYHTSSNRKLSNRIEFNKKWARRRNVAAIQPKSTTNTQDVNDDRKDHTTSAESTSAYARNGTINKKVNKTTPSQKTVYLEIVQEAAVKSAVQTTVLKPIDAILAANHSINQSKQLITFKTTENSQISSEDLQPNKKFDISKMFTGDIACHKTAVPHQNTITELLGNSMLTAALPLYPSLKSSNSFKFQYFQLNQRFQFLQHWRRLIFTLSLFLLILETPLLALQGAYAAPQSCVLCDKKDLQPSSKDPSTNYEEFLFEHQVTRQDAINALKGLNETFYRVGYSPDNSCKSVSCTKTVMRYCLSPQFINDHCWCEYGHTEEGLPFVPHICYVGEKVYTASVGSCFFYEEVKECCCAAALAKQWRHISAAPRISSASKFALLLLSNVLLVIIVFTGQRLRLTTFPI